MSEPQVTLGLRFHTEYNLTPRGLRMAKGHGWIDWRKAKRLQRQGRFEEGSVYEEASRTFLKRYREYCRQYPAAIGP